MTSKRSTTRTAKPYQWHEQIQANVMRKKHQNTKWNNENYIIFAIEMWRIWNWIWKGTYRFFQSMRARGAAGERWDGFAAISWKETELRSDGWYILVPFSQNKWSPSFGYEFKKLILLPSHVTQTIDSSQISYIIYSLT